MADDILALTRAILPTTPPRWTSLAQHVPADLLTRAPASGEWSALECLQHLVDTEHLVFPVRIRALLAGQDFPAFDPDAQGDLQAAPSGPAELAAAFAALRAESLALLSTLTPADLDRQARHAELGIVSLSELLHEWVGHDLMHTIQAERALLQPFILGCGPWQSYFQDHLAQKPVSGVA
ncbi:MAG: DinB family protein [Chloroflexales bacterium]